MIYKILFCQHLKGRLDTTGIRQRIAQNKIHALRLRDNSCRSDGFEKAELIVGKKCGQRLIVG